MFDFCNINYIIEYKKIKSVKFNNIVTIYLIPSIKDYIELGIINKIWYSEDDYKLFIKENNIQIKII
jgi:hypothetical protein